jgi:hypothetical protein
MFRWFDRHLKDHACGVPDWPTSQYTVSGPAALGMRRAAGWPLAGSTPVLVELAAPSRALVADSAKPAPTLGSSHLTVSAGMQDQRPLLTRADVVELRGTALSAATLMAGGAGQRPRLGAPQNSTTSALMP